MQFRTLFCTVVVGIKYEVGAKSLKNKTIGRKWIHLPNNECISAKTCAFSNPSTLHRLFLLWNPKTTILTQITELFSYTYELGNIFWWNAQEFKHCERTEVILSRNSITCVLVRVNCVTSYQSFVLAFVSFARKWSSSLSSPIDM